MSKAKGCWTCDTSTLEHEEHLLNQIQYHLDALRKAILATKKAKETSMALDDLIADIKQ